MNIWAWRGCIACYAVAEYRHGAMRCHEQEDFMFEVARETRRTRRSAYMTNPGFLQMRGILMRPAILLFIWMCLGACDGGESKSAQRIRPAVNDTASATTQSSSAGSETQATDSLTDTDTASEAAPSTDSMYDADSTTGDSGSAGVSGTDDDTGTDSVVSVSTEQTDSGGHEATDDDTDTPSAETDSDNTSTDTDSVTSLEPDSETDSETAPVSTDTDSATSSETDSVSTDSDTTTESDSSTDTIPTEGCGPDENFASCSDESDADAQYMICMWEACISPGCGEASCNVNYPAVAIPDTNQTQCFDNTQEISCPSAGSAFYGQDAQYGDRRQASGGTPVYSLDSGQVDNPVQRDNTTGLYWQGCTSGTYGASCTAGELLEMTWQDAVQYCETLNWDDRVNWRLPTEFELMSLIYVNRSPSIDQSVFPNTPASSFWTNASHYNDSSAWNVDFAHGNIYYADKDFINYVRCVSGDYATSGIPAVVATVPDEPEVVFPSTELVWQGCPAGLSGLQCGSGEVSAMQWQQALEYCETLEWASQSDWRLPNRNELLSIRDNRQNFSAISPVLFPGTAAFYFWTSTTGPENFANAFFVYFADGYQDDTNKNNDNHVRCVRDL